MPYTVSVTVHIDLDLQEIRLAVSGCLIAHTCLAPLSIVRQARRLESAPFLTLDLTGAEHVDLDGLMRLQHATARERSRTRGRRPSRGRGDVRRTQAPRCAPSCWHHWRDVSEDHLGRLRLARLRRVHELAFEGCFSESGTLGTLRRGLDPGFASRALLGLVLNADVRERTVGGMQAGVHDGAPAEEMARLARSFLWTDASE